jgi:DNA-binding response OmpR family regulator
MDTTMHNEKLYAYLVQCASVQERMSSLLSEAGFNTTRNYSIPEIVSLFASGEHRSTNVVLSCVQEGGLAMVQLLSQIETRETQPSIILVDTDADVKAAIKAIRHGISDYWLSRETNEQLINRLDRIKQRISSQTAPHTEGIHALAETKTSKVETHRARPRIWWDASLGAIRSDDMWVPLSPIEWKLFETLVNKRGSVVTTEELIAQALNREGSSDSDTSLLRLHVSRLRAKLNEHFSQELNIVTMRGRGYMIV